MYHAFLYPKAVSKLLLWPAAEAGARAMRSTEADEVALAQVQ